MHTVGLSRHFRFTCSLRAQTRPRVPKRPCFGARRRASRPAATRVYHPLRPSAEAYLAAGPIDGGIVEGKATWMLYPMHVVRVEDFLGMVRAKPQHVLVKQGLAVHFRPELGAVVFVSHQWGG